MKLLMHQNRNKMKIMVFLILIIVAYMAFFKQAPDPVELAKYEAKQTLIKEQEQILEQLQTYNNKEVQIFIDQWREFAKEPSNEQLAELKKIKENIKKNPSVANEYTIQWHEKNSLCGKATTTMGKSDCAPGL